MKKNMVRKSVDGENDEEVFFCEDCCPDIFADLRFNITLERRGGFYNYILILPCVLLSCLTCILFWLPVCDRSSDGNCNFSSLSSSSRKVHRSSYLVRSENEREKSIESLVSSLGMNIFTSFFVLLLLLYKNMPSNAEHIPRIGTGNELISTRQGTSVLSSFRRLLLFKHGYDCYIDISLYDRGAYLFPRQWTDSKISTQGLSRTSLFVFLRNV